MANVAGQGGGIVPFWLKVGQFAEQRGGERIRPRRRCAGGQVGRVRVVEGSGRALDLARDREVTKRHFAHGVVHSDHKPLSETAPEQLAPRPLP